METRLLPPEGFAQSDSDWVLGPNRKLQEPMSEHGMRVTGERSLERLFAHISSLPEAFCRFPFTAPGLFLELRRISMFESHKLLRELSDS